jgi:hypothetical protein
MIPKKELNIYPKNEMNIQTLIKFYFTELELGTEGVVNYIMNVKTSLELNQIEFLCRKINEGYPTVFRPNLNGRIELKNLLNYAIDALTIDKSKWNGSQSRKRITQEFKDFVKQTETDFDF